MCAEARLKLTDDGHDDDCEVEHVPRVLEVVVSEPDELEETLGREYGHEDDVDDVKYPLKVVGRLVVLDRHRKHVQQDDDHYEDVEFLIGGQFKDGQRTLQLHTYNAKQWRTNDIIWEYKFN